VNLPSAVEYTIVVIVDRSCLNAGLSLNTTTAAATGSPRSLVTTPWVSPMFPV
jgi:hypothetical protein